MAKKELTPSPQQVANLLQQAPTFDMAAKVLQQAIDAGRIDYQALAAGLMPAVADLRIAGFHISSTSKLRHPAYIQADTFSEQPKLLTALVRLGQNKLGMNGIQYYAVAPFVFPNSARVILVGEQLDIPGMAAATDFWQQQLLGRRNDSYSPHAAPGSPEAIEWLVKPNDRAGSPPKSIVADLGDVDPQFMRAHELTRFLDTQPAETKADAGLTEDALRAFFGL